MLPEQSHEKMEYAVTDDKGIHRHDLRSSDLKNNVVELHAVALDSDLDLWHNRTLRESIFLSDALTQALKDANMARLWRMHTCKMI